MIKLFISLFFLLFITSNNLAQSEWKHNFSGLAFGDYFWVVQDHNEDFDSENGFRFRRIYFTYDGKIADKFSVRLRLDMADPGDFETEEALVPFVKDAYLKYQFGLTQIIGGISGPPAFAVIEKYWGFRSVEKTPLDLQRMEPSRDFGISIKGSIDKEKEFRYHFMFANGNGVQTETDVGKKYMLSAGYFPTKNLVFELYGDYDYKGNSEYWTTAQIYFGYKTEQLSVGLLYANQLRSVGEKINLRVFSFYITGKIVEKLKYYGRIDRNFDPNPGGEKIRYIPFSNEASNYFVLLGFDYELAKNIYFQPNVELVLYDETTGGETITNDIQPRFTFYFKF